MEKFTKTGYSTINNKNNIVYSPLRLATWVNIMVNNLRKPEFYLVEKEEEVCSKRIVRKALKGKHHQDHQCSCRLPSNIPRIHCWRWIACRLISPLSNIASSNLESALCKMQHLTNDANYIMQSSYIQYLNQIQVSNNLFQCLCVTLQIYRLSNGTLMIQRIQNKRCKILT